MIIFEKQYFGFEDLFDLQRDILECFNKRFNDKVKDIPTEFEGTVKVTIEYDE